MSVWLDYMANGRINSSWLCLCQWIMNTIFIIWTIAKQQIEIFSCSDVWTFPHTRHILLFTLLSSPFFVSFDFPIYRATIKVVFPIAIQIICVAGKSMCLRHFKVYGDENKKQVQPIKLFVRNTHTSQRLRFCKSVNCSFLISDKFLYMCIIKAFL